MNLLNLGTFTLASGRQSSLTIDADALMDSDIEAAASLLAAVVGPFSEAVGVPRGGLRLAAALNQHAKKGGPLLVCDDVYTTGGSVVRFMATEPRLALCRCAVLFARGVTPPWVAALFRLHADLESV